MGSPAALLHTAAAPTGFPRAKRFPNSRPFRLSRIVPCPTSVCAPRPLTFAAELKTLAARLMKRDTSINSMVFMLSGVASVLTAGSSAAPHESRKEPKKMGEAWGCR